jgi:hypothetical protein
MEGISGFEISKNFRISLQSIAEVKNDGAMLSLPHTSSFYVLNYLRLGIVLPFQQSCKRIIPQISFYIYKI